MSLPPPLRLILAALTVVVVATGLSACGGSSGAAATSAKAASAPAGALAYQQKLVSVISDVAPRVVQVQTSKGLGSGVVFDDRGDIVTNAHVVGSSTSFTITDAAGTRSSATLVGVFAPGDLAVVRAKGAKLRPATFGRSSDLKVGDIALAIGNPLGLRSSVTNGIVSALGRTVPEPGGAVLPGAIQTSAPINPGNSGGALVDLSGEVIGIPTLAAVDPELGGSAAPGIGFAIPSDVVRDIAGQIIKYGHVVNSHRAYLGVQLAAGYAGQGAVVAKVVKGGPAAAAGIRAGDTLLSIAGKDTSSAADVSTVLATLDPGAKIPVRVRHDDGTQATVTVTLGQYPTSSSS
ncbi:PDZ domain-containing protein [Baekduia soli]|uniref:PDZ domain-containing protein n=1 Tax=Baekduia soli TaxID=496014 RepID=A0A5B8U5R9_9ACTN|nr:trypsin-like peptidase domain-containing protein [Baekduia soli]QEC48281.1 PDZ domain-containing protein [Baekduia soli]